jgi:hypothetical protein
MVWYGMVWYGGMGRPTHKDCIFVDTDGVTRQTKRDMKVRLLNETP